jgi:DNA-binding Lrp family transcriptional regulator
MPHVIDRIDRRILEVIDREPRATVQYIAEASGVARGTVYARLARLRDADAVAPATSRLRPRAVGRPLRVIVTAQVDQSDFDGMVDDLSAIPEVIECLGISGGSDLQIEIVAVDADDVYRITQQLMGCRGIHRTSSAFVLRELIPRRFTQLLDADLAAR